MKNFYMQQAIDLAWRYQFLTYPNPAVGACVVRNNEILAIGVHQFAGGPHAEVNAIKKAYLKIYPDSPLQNLKQSFEIHEYLIDNHNNLFHDCEIYVTLEPCNHVGKTPACATLLKELQFKKVIIGTLDPNNQASGGKTTLEESEIEVEVGVLQKKCDDLLFPFLQWHKEERFRFFKLAIRANGTCDGGYITTQDSLNLVHEIRAKLDLLIIGGNTVRIDRPTLDSRFSQTKKPSDILIYSFKKEFDQTIPLFTIPNRDVFIDDNLSKYTQKFSMIEGGWSLLETLKNKIDMVLLFVSFKDSDELSFDPRKYNLELLYSYQINEFDSLYFYKTLL